MKKRIAADLLRDGPCLLQARATPAARGLQPGRRHGLLEQLAVFGHLAWRAGWRRSAPRHTCPARRFGQRHGQVEARLPAHGRQQGIGTLLRR